MGERKHGCGLTRAQAEILAFGCCVAEWLNHNPVRSPPGWCLRCGGENHSHDPLLPHGVESTGYAWLHSRCWHSWYADQENMAVAALVVMGIGLGAEFPNDFGKNGGA
jgi:hypothetical protein